MLWKALLLNSRLQKRAIVFFEFRSDLLIQRQASISRLSTSILMDFMILITKYSSSLSPIKSGIPDTSMLFRLPYYSQCLNLFSRTSTLLLNFAFSHYETKKTQYNCSFWVFFLLITIVRLFGSLRISTRQKLLIMRKSFLVSSKSFLILRKGWEKIFFCLNEITIIFTEIHPLKLNQKIISKLSNYLT